MRLSTSQSATVLALLSGTLVTDVRRKCAACRPRCRRRMGVRVATTPKSRGSSVRTVAQSNVRLCDEQRVSWFKRPRHHQRELFSPERVAVRPDALDHDDLRPCAAQRARPSARVFEEERLQRSGNEVRARKRARHHSRRSVATARRSAEDYTVEIRASKPDSERQFSARGHTEYRGALGRQRDSEARPHPPADFLDEELLVSSEPLRFEAW